MAAATAKNWLYKATGEIEYLLCITYQDPFLKKYRAAFENLPVKIVYHMVGNMVKQLNHAAKLATGDLFVNVSDDFDCPKDWDKLLIDALKGKQDFVVKTNDGVEADGIHSANIIALPIMDRVYYNRFKYIYHPAYGHFFGDEELSNVGDKLKRKITLPITFEHIHYVAGKAKIDATNVKNNKHFDQDKKTFERRKAKNFEG